MVVIRLLASSLLLAVAAEVLIKVHQIQAVKAEVLAAAVYVPDLGVQVIHQQLHQVKEITVVQVQMLPQHILEVVVAVLPLLEQMEQALLAVMVAMELHRLYLVRP